MPQPASTPHANAQLSDLATPHSHFAGRSTKQVEATPTFLDREAGIFTLDLAAHAQILDQLFDFAKETTRGLTARGSDIPTRIAFNLTSDEAGMKLRRTPNRDLPHEGYSARQRRDLRPLVIDVLDAMMLDSRFQSLLEATPKQIRLIPKTYRGTSHDPDNFSFHVHEENFYSGIIGIQEPGQYQGGDLVIARAKKKLYEEMEIMSAGVRSPHPQRVGTLSLSDLPAISEHIYFNQKPELYQGIFWPEALASDQIPAAEFLEHAVTDIIGKRMVLIFAVETVPEK